MENPSPDQTQPPTEFSEIPQPKKSKKGVSLSFILSVLLILVTAIAVFFYWQNTRLRNQLKDQIEQTTPTISPISSPTPFIDPMESWKEYSTSTYSFKYPPDMILTEGDASHAKVVKLGPTQKAQTEVYDGILINFQPYELPGVSTSTYAKNVIQKELGPDGKIVEEVTDTELNGLPASTFTIESLGTFTFYVVQDEKEIMLAVISYTAPDPEDSGHQAIVDQILSTFEFVD